MIWFDKWLERIDHKQSRTTQTRLPSSLFAYWGVGINRSTKRNYETLVRDGYSSNPVVRRAVQIVAESLADLPLSIHIDGQAVENCHPILELLHAPNPTTSGVNLCEAIAAYLMLHGNAYIEMIEGADGTPEELYALRPERVTLVSSETGWPAYYKYTVDGKSIKFGIDAQTGRSDLLHIKSFHPVDDYYGSSLLESAETAIETHNAASRWSLALLENAARPSGALVYEGGENTLSSEQYNRLRQEMDEQFSGATNAGRPLLLEGGLKWQALSLTPSDLDFINGKYASARDIALAFGVPPILLNIPGDATYANYQEANRSLYRSTVLPLAGKIFDSLTNWLKLYWPGLRIEPDLDRIPALAADREGLWRQISAADFLTTTERRKLLGLPPVADG